VADSRAPGLRLQIVLALGGLMLLAFVPLFIAVASVTRATLLGARVEQSKALARAVAAHVAEVRAGGDHDGTHLKHALASHVGAGGVEALRVFDAKGALVAEAGSAAELATMDAPERPYREASLVVRGAFGRALDVVTPANDAAIVARMRTDEEADRTSPLVRLMALYTATFALALIVFAYFALTRLIVRPIEALVRAADHVVGGARSLDVPRAGARELAELGASVQAMTTHLLADEQAMRLKIEELTRAGERLKSAQNQLARSEKLASVGRLAAGIGHEIGNPIAALLGMEELLLDGDLPLETQRDFIVRMKKETERIHTVLRDLLDFARPEQEPPSARPDPADVGEVVKDVLALVRPQKAFRAIEVAARLDGEPLRVGLSASRLTQVLLNLTLNAGDAIGSAAVGASATGHVTIHARREDAFVRIEVEDDGPGIPAELRERIFEPFVTTKEVGAGTGLGLAVCRGLVEAAGGTIDAENAAQGARMVVRLPAQAGSLPAP
jgi:signal transduction histidine kinase